MLTSRRKWRNAVVLVTVAAALAAAAPTASASARVVPQAQCRGDRCTMQITFRAASASTATVLVDGRKTRMRVVRGASRRLVTARVRSTKPLVEVSFEGATVSRRVPRRQFPANRVGSTCAALAPTEADLSVGPTQTTAGTILSRGTRKMAVIFVDFRDAPATQSTSSVLKEWMIPGTRWLQTSSWGRLKVKLAPRTPKWLRMPRPSGAYGMQDGVTFDEHRSYLQDAIALADPRLDFSEVDGVYVVASEQAQLPISPTFRGAVGTFMADGRALGPAVTFGADAYTYGRTILPHETGHMMGLPDLYPYVGGGHRFVGVWDIMGNVFQHTDLTAWQRRKLGWLDEGQLLCAKKKGTSWATLNALGTKGGPKAIFVRTGRFTGVVVENRQRVGNDRGICDPGALVYKLDSRVPSGFGPIRIVGGNRDHEGCGHGPRSIAPLDPGQGIRSGRVFVKMLGARGRVTEVSVTVR